MRETNIQKPKTIAVAVASAGTSQRLVAADSPYRFVNSFYIEALHSNTGDIYVGDADVTSTQYATCLAAREAVRFDGDELLEPGTRRVSTYDLYNVWVDADVTDEVLMLTVGEDM